jgi:ribonuclease J
MRELASGAVRLVPLGGLGEIGMNCLAIEQADGIVVVDCGIAFPEGDLGIDVIHPDFSWLLERADRVKGVFLTHGHEDHVGALPFLLQDLDVPIWGAPHALGVARRRLYEHDFTREELDLRPAQVNTTYDVGPFRIEPVRVTHSIVQASALRIQTRAGTILHTGDFNLDPDPPDGDPTDLARLSAIGDEGVALMLSDSTNADVLMRGGSERMVAAAVESIVSQARGRVVIALFASNVQRLITFGAMAERLGRKICVLGRSLDAQITLASEIGRLKWPSDLLIPLDQAATIARDRLLVLAGGTQAEPSSAMRRLALGQHPAFRLEAGDSVIMSSRVIPGNERGVNTMQNDLLRLGVVLHTQKSDPGVHTSGHAARPELERMIELLRPRCFLPVHGTLHHMLTHRELARDMGVRETVVIEDGTPLVCDGNALETEPKVQSGRVAIAQGGEPASDQTLKARAELGRCGVIFVSLAVDGRGRGITPPRVVVKGVPAIDTDADLGVLAREAARALEVYREGRGLEQSEFVRRAVRRKAEDLSGARPLVEVIVNTID